MLANTQKQKLKALASSSFKSHKFPQIPTTQDTLALPSEMIIPNFQASEIIIPNFHASRCRPWDPSW